MSRLVIMYPHCEPTLVYAEEGREVWMGNISSRPNVSDVIVQTPDWPNVVADNLLVLVPPMVQPRGYSDSFRRQFSLVFAHTGSDSGNVISYRHRLPPLWPALPMMNKRPWHERKKAVIAVCSNKYMERRVDLVALAESCQRAGYEFDVYGRVPFDEAWYRGPIERLDAKVEVMSQYRFAYAEENQYDLPFYRTEKMPEALAAGCVPICRNLGSSYTFSNVETMGLYFLPDDDCGSTLMRTIHDWPGYDAMVEDMRFDHVARLMLNVLGVPCT